MEGIKITQIQLENLEKEINKALAVSTVLENELGIQRDSVSANAVCDKRVSGAYKGYRENSRP